MKPSKELESPFLVKQRPIVWSYSSTLDDLYHFTIKSLESSESLQEVWVSSEVPSVNLKFAHIREAVKKEGKLDSDCLKLAIRNMATEDAENHKNTKCLGWRHYVDSDWTEYVARGLDNWDTTFLKTVFSRRSILYNASDSHLVLIPVFLNEHWTLYAFNMSDRKLSILDSLPDPTPGVLDPAERHKPIRPQVCAALNFTMDTALDMSENDFRSWTYEFPKVPRQRNSYDCGFFMFNFMRLWDGHQLVQSFPTGSSELRKDFLAYILSCKDNKANLPPRVSRWITNLSEEAKLARKERQSWARDPMDKRLLKAAREGDVKTFERLVGCVEAPELGCHEQVGEVDGQGAAALGGDPAADERTIDVRMLAAGMNRRAEANSIPPHICMLLQGASSDGDGVLHIAASHGHVELTRAVLRALGVVLPDPNVGAAAEPESSNTEEGATTGSGAAAEPESSRSREFLRARNHKGETCLHGAVRCGYKELVELLVLADAGLVQIADDEGISPLYLASTLRSADIARVLTASRYSPSYYGPGGKTALHAAVLWNEELTRQLLDWKKDLIYIADESGSTPLHFVASVGHEIIAKLLLEKDSDGAYCPDAKGSLPIHVAAAEGRLDMIELLLQKYPDCMWSLDASGQSFLHVAVQKRQEEVVAYVCKEQRLARYFNIRLARYFNIRLLRFFNIRLPIYFSIRDKATFFNIRDQEGNTALHLAVRNGKQSVFCSLISKMEVHLSLINKEGHTPLDLAVLSLPSGLRYLQTPREWILYDLILAEADFGTCRWDHFTSKITKPEKEKYSKAISKSAGLGAVCAVLILTVAFAAPFNVAKFYLDSSGGAGHQAGSRSTTNRARQHAFRAFIISDAMAFAYSAIATFLCTLAGFPIVDRQARFHYLNTAWNYLRYAAVSMVAVFMLGVYVVVAPVDVPVAMAACGFAILAIVPHGTAVAMMFIHSAALCRRLGFLPLLRAVSRKYTVRRRDRVPYKYHHLHLGSLQAVVVILVFCGAVTWLTFAPSRSPW